MRASPFLRSSGGTGSPGSSLNERVIVRLAALGVTLFRLNLSHTRLDEARDRILYVQRATDVPLCLDTEGAQVRTADFVEPTLQLRENSSVRLHRRPVPGDPGNFNLYPETILDELVAGDFLSIDAQVLAQVLRVEPDHATLRVLAGGPIGRNKAVTIERDVPLPPLTSKDLATLAIGRELGIRHVALSAEVSIETSLVDPARAAGHITSYPNPFHPGEAPATIAYKLSADARVTLTWYTLLGTEVRRDEYPPGLDGGREGLNNVQWDGRNGRGDVVASGGYLLVVEAEGQGETLHVMRRRIAVVR